MKKVVLTAIGHYHPENLIENHFFDELGIESDANWVEERTGIESRTSVLSKSDILELRHGRTTLSALRGAGKVPTIADIAEKSWAQMKSRFPATNISSVDTLICGTSVPDFDIPANACSVAGRLGLSCLAFDVNSACSSFVTDLHVAKNLLRGGDSHSMVAIVNPERYSLRMDYSDKRTCILFGDGCTSAIISNNGSDSGLEVIDTLIVSDPVKFDLITIADEGFFQQNGKAVQKFAITKTIDTTREILARNDLTPADISYFLGHQANLRMVTSAADRLGLPPERHLFNVDKLGNQGAAGAPAVLSANWDRFKPGDIIVVTVVGSGLTWGAVLFRKT